MFGFLGFLIFGLIVGAIAKLMLPGRDPGGIFVTMLLGMIGAALGGWLGRAMGFYGADEPAGLIMAVIGSIVLLLIYRAIVGRGPRTV
jgi:uncharacterized membrane protein YeaQ/YmgE (transglycosylase-associated protein family)